MKAIQEAGSPADRSRLRKKCAELMALGEKLKTGESPPVEAGMSSLSLGSKAQPAKPPPSQEPKPGAAKPPPTEKKAPMSTRELSKKEQIILLKASRLLGSVFPPWDAPPADEVFKLASSAGAPFK